MSLIVVAPDMPGPYSQTHLAADIARIMERHGPGGRIPEA
jgi:hypothetical protein